MQSGISLQNTACSFVLCMRFWIDKYHIYFHVGCCGWYGAGRAVCVCECNSTFRSNSLSLSLSLSFVTSHVLRYIYLGLNCKNFPIKYTCFIFAQHASERRDDDDNRFDERVNLFRVYHFIDIYI